MFNLHGLKGGYLNNYAQPSQPVFKARARQVAYMVIKYGMPDYEQWCRDISVPWLAEIYPYRSSCVGDAQKLANQAMQPGCVGAVVNMESGSGPGVADWDLDDGSAATTFARTFGTNAPGVPLYASIDTRGDRPTKPYQGVLRTWCNGVFPMIFPKDFQQSTQAAIATVLPGCARWMEWGKPVIPTIQGYDNIGADQVVDQVIRVNAQATVSGINLYTIGHATNDEWTAFVNTAFSRPSIQEVSMPTNNPAPTPTPSPAPAPAPVANALEALRVKWLESLTMLALAGTPDKVQAFLNDWNGMIATANK